MPFAVFIIRNGSWSLWAEYTNKANAEQEASYLNNKLGVTANVFKRNP